MIGLDCRYLPFYSFHFIHHKHPQTYMVHTQFYVSNMPTLKLTCYTLYQFCSSTKPMPFDLVQGQSAELGRRQRGRRVRRRRRPLRSQDSVQGEIREPDSAHSGGPDRVLQSSKRKGSSSQASQGLYFLGRQCKHLWSQYLSFLCLF